VFGIAESPIEPGLIWAGTNDGLLHVTRDNGATWTNYSVQVNTGTNTEISIGYKLGTGRNLRPNVGWDTLLIEESQLLGRELPERLREPLPRLHDPPHLGDRRALLEETSEGIPELRAFFGQVEVGQL